jgi:adenosylmethionine-8-amino-7-oxononanoate aminotransferase
MYQYPVRYLQAVRTLTEDYGIPLIVDEVAVGFGRTGRMFASALADIRPDVMCLSKALTGGYLPMGVTLATDALFEAFYADYNALKTFFHGHSYTGNPLGCALGLEVLSILREERILEGLGPRIEALQSGFQALSELPYVRNVRGLGMIAALDLVHPGSGEGFSFEQRVGYRVCRAALRRGLYVRPLGDVLYLLPPLVITVEEIRWSISMLQDAMAEVMGAGLG